MTTIAFDGATLAGDTKIADECTLSYARKVFVLNRGAVGVAGDFARANEFVAWLRKWERGVVSDPPKELTDVGAMYVNHKGEIYEFEESAIPYRILRAKHAIGSGAQAAMALMLSGYSAAGAVRGAAKVDVGTGGRIVVLKIKGR